MIENEFGSFPILSPHPVNKITTLFTNRKKLGRKLKENLIEKIRI